MIRASAADWATGLVFEPDDALQAWRGFLDGIESVNFSAVPSDVVGRIFQKLISPEERHRYGQHFTGDDAVDLINVFCIRSADATVLDPACGSGSFLVRSYYRKLYLEPGRDHAELISELFGCDIGLYPAHLATLNLAAREINEEANYPRIARRNFFGVEPNQQFCTIPDTDREPRAIVLPQVDAIVGNPPYVRQEQLDRREKQRMADLCASAWPGLAFKGRSDLHCYFWPAAARFLTKNGYFGFLTSSSWLDVEYGFPLQAWILRNFRVRAIFESSVEPWFEDARVKTCITILQRCENAAERSENITRFVRLRRPLRDILGLSTTSDEAARQVAFEMLRDHIMDKESDFQDGNVRIVVKKQAALWADGVRAGTLLNGTATVSSDDAGDASMIRPVDRRRNGVESAATVATDYGAGKWGRYLRAPDFYFDVMRRLGERFVPLGELVSIRRGITSGCDAFFMPKDVSDEMLQQYRSARAFRERTGVSRLAVEGGKLRIVEAGDGSRHPIESAYLEAEVHSLMAVDRPVVRTEDVERVVLLVTEENREKGSASKWVRKYLQYGAQATFSAGRSGGLAVPRRSTCAAREPWYDLTRVAGRGFAFWPKSQQYRHIVPANPDEMVCNCNLYYIRSVDLGVAEQATLIAILNSTLIGLFKTFCGRYAGTEGNLKTEIVDVNVMEIPDPRRASRPVAQRLQRAVLRLRERTAGRLVEEQLMMCHDPAAARRIARGPVQLAEELLQADRRDLDGAVFEMLGVREATERENLVRRLYEATSRHFRDIRVVEIEKARQRRGGRAGRYSLAELATDIWTLAGIDGEPTVVEWVSERPESEAWIRIPSERPAVLWENPLFPDSTVYFGQSRRERVNCGTTEQARLVRRLAELGVVGDVKVPDGGGAEILREEVDARVGVAKERFEGLAEARTSNTRQREQLVEMLLLWYVRGQT